MALGSSLYHARSSGPSKQFQVLRRICSQWQPRNWPTFERSCREIILKSPRTHLGWGFFLWFNWLFSAWELKIVQFSGVIVVEQTTFLQPIFIWKCFKVLSIQWSHILIFLWTNTIHLIGFIYNLHITASCTVLSRWFDIWFDQTYGFPLPFRQKCSVILNRTW